PRDDFSDRARHGIDLSIEAVDLGAEPTNFNCESVDFCIDCIKPAVDGIKPLIDFLRSLFDHLLEAKEVKMDLSNDGNEKSNLSFHFTNPLFQPGDAIFKRCRGHGCSWSATPYSSLNPSRKSRVHINSSTVGNAPRPHANRT